MTEPWETRQRADRDQLLRQSPLRAEHVWLKLSVGFVDEWVPGVLSEWKRTEDGEWLGCVSFVRRWWSETPSQPGNWSVIVSQMWAKSGRIQRIDVAPPA